jgi:hypothetical protein
MTSSRIKNITIPSATATMSMRSLLDSDHHGRMTIRQARITIL